MAILYACVVYSIVFVAQSVPNCQIPAINTGTIHDHHVRLQPSFLSMDAWMTSQLNVELIRNYVGH